MIRGHDDTAKTVEIDRKESHHDDGGAASARLSAISEQIRQAERQNQRDLGRDCEEMAPLRRCDLELECYVGQQGRRIACGIANYESEAISRIRGIRSDHIQDILGYDYGQEVVHRNNLVLL